MSISALHRRLAKLEAKERAKGDWRTRLELKCFADAPFDAVLVRHRQSVRLKLRGLLLLRELARDGFPVPRELLRDPERHRAYLARFPGTAERDERSIPMQLIAQGRTPQLATTKPRSPELREFMRSVGL